MLQLLYGDRLGPLTLLIFSWTGILLLTGGVAGTTGLIQLLGLIQAPSTSSNDTP